MTIYKLTVSTDETTYYEFYKNFEHAEADLVEIARSLDMELDKSSRFSRYQKNGCSAYITSIKVIDDSSPVLADSWVDCIDDILEVLLN